jgi:2-dehydropantoate 2-reductase
MRIAIVGPGALGCLFATKLFATATKHNSIILIDHRPERAELLNQQGIICESKNGTETFSIPVFHVPETIPAVDIVFSCVKSYDLQQSLAFLQPLLTPKTLLIFLQNGISHLQYNNDEKLGATPCFATSSEGATHLTAGHIRHAGCGHTILGFLSRQAKHATEQLRHLLPLLQTSGIASSLTGDIHSKLWAKLFVNVGINGLTVLENCRNGQLLESDRTRKKLTTLVKEAEAVAHAQGIIISADPVQATLAVCKSTSMNISSMLQDIRNKRPTEIEAINGSVSRIGKELNIPTPENDTLINTIKSIETSATALFAEKNK